MEWMTANNKDKSKNLKSMTLICFCSSFPWWKYVHEFSDMVKFGHKSRFRAHGAYSYTFYMYEIIQIHKKNWNLPQQAIIWRAYICTDTDIHTYIFYPECSDSLIHLEPKNRPVKCDKVKCDRCQNSEFLSRTYDSWLPVERLTAWQHRKEPLHWQR